MATSKTGFPQTHAALSSFLIPAPRTGLRRSAPLRAALSAATLATVVLLQLPAHAEDPLCLSASPADWPASSRPYFMVVVDTSGSMTSGVASAPSCSGYPSNRIGHARCAVKNTVLAYSGQVNFGLASFAWRSQCSDGTCGTNDCFSSCTAQYAPFDNAWCGPWIAEPTLGANIHAGADINVQMLQDHYWSQPPDASNVASILGLTDNTCCNTNGEIGADSYTPLGGVLFSMNQYFAGTFQDKFNNPLQAPLPSPIGPAPQERPCRSLNVILITDGNETCDGAVNPVPIAGGCRSGQASYLNNSNERLASYEADRMWTNGVTVSGQNFKIKTHVIGFTGASMTALNHIAVCGGTVQARSTADEAALSSALAAIIAGSIQPETCDNADNNCNGCTDEGSTHYCDVSQTCCAWGTDAQRTTCLTNYLASISGGDPDGDLTLLPCTSIAQQADPLHWLCYNPGEACDGIDNNCSAGIDESVLKCGNPAHCPTAEICNQEDDDCDGIIDEGVCQGCTPSTEICDGCDNDCDGLIDENIASLPCGLASPPNCVGQLVCNEKPNPGGTLGACVGGGFSACSNDPDDETCDGIDNDCDGIADDGVASIPCLPDNAPAGLNYGPQSQCKMGDTQCSGGQTACNGWIGPSAEVCDGVDNDCNGVVDDGVPGVGNFCGVNQAPCTPGLTACVNGAIVCQGGNPPQNEVCDGIDNNCNGDVDETPLFDAPPSPGCWNEPGNCCTFGPLSWCPPAGASCDGVGMLVAPCNVGSITCQAGAWICKNPKGPSPEACDGIDNDCDGLLDGLDPDLGAIPPIGDACGPNCLGQLPCPCTQGVQECANGSVECVGGNQGGPEQCNGIDDDCNGVIDDNLPVGQACWPAFDELAFPHTPSGQSPKPLPCMPGVYVCDGNGSLICQGGTGPTPELCDLVDNDCDGQTDETGVAPDGLDGTANPFPPPDATIGEACGTDLGICKAGTYKCEGGLFTCDGEQVGGVEICDCTDNDCDGQTDEPPTDGSLCTKPSATCVKSTVGCQCAERCKGEVQPCPPGFKDEFVTDSNTGEPVGCFCVRDYCGDCATKTITDGGGAIVCAPADSPPDANCVPAPVCECKGLSCDTPCSGITCTAPQLCTDWGPKAGECVDNNCWNIPCVGCDNACNLGACVDDPCVPNPCDPDEVCRPNVDFTDHACTASCAGVECASDEVCVDGVCEKTCAPECGPNEICDEATDTCVENKCPAPLCADGSCCDAASGVCGNCPCEGVACPSGQQCKAGQCVEPTGQGGSGQGGDGDGGVTTGGSGGSGNGGQGPSSTGGLGGSKGIWGLSTGGGGCSCDLAATPRDRVGAWALLALATALARRRRRSGDDEEVCR